MDTLCYKPLTTGDAHPSTDIAIGWVVSTGKPTHYRYVFNPRTTDISTIDPSVRLVNLLISRQKCIDIFEAIFEVFLD